LCGGISRSSEAFDVAEAGGWLAVIKACNAVQAGKAWTPDTIRLAKRR